jgi:MFS transporter, DHA1 family, tetracycline resistance protein
LSNTGRKAAIGFILVTVFLDVVGFALIIPVLPALVGEFTTNRDAQSYWYGILGAAYGLMQFCASPLLGSLSDRYGRRPVLLVSVFGLGVDFLLQAMANSLWVLLAARLIGGLTGATFSVANAYIADITEPEERSRAFGLIGAVFGLGFIIGPMLGGLLGTADIRLPFYVAAAVSLANWLYGYFVLPESLPRESRGTFSFAKANPFSALKDLAELRGIGSLVVVFALTNLAQFILHTTWVLYTEIRFGWGPRDNGIALFVVGVAAAIVQGVLLGRILKLWGEERAAVIGLAFGAIAFALYGLATSGWMMYAIIVITLLSGAAAPAMQGLVSKAVDPTKQGLAMGSLSGVASIMGIIAPLIGTVVLAQVSHLPANDWRIGATFFLSAALEGLALIIAWRILHRKHDRSKARG